MNISGGQKVYVEDPRTGRLVEVRQAQQAPTSAAPQPTQPNQLYTLNPDGTLRPYSEAPNPAAAGGNAPYVGAANSGVGGGGYGASPGVNTYQKKKRPGGGMLAGLLGALTCGLCADSVLDSGMGHGGGMGGMGMGGMGMGMGGLGMMGMMGGGSSSNFGGGGSDGGYGGDDFGGGDMGDMGGGDF